MFQVFGRQGLDGLAPTSSVSPGLKDRLKSNLGIGWWVSRQRVSASRVYPHVCDMQAEPGVQNVLFRFAVDIPHGSHRKAEVQVVQVALESEHRRHRSGCLPPTFLTLGHFFPTQASSQEDMQPEELARECVARIRPSWSPATTETCRPLQDLHYLFFEN